MADPSANNTNARVRGKEEGSFIDPRHRAVIARAMEFQGLMEIKNKGEMLPHQPLYLDPETGRPYVPGKIINRSDLPEFFSSSPAKCIDPDTPNVLLLQDLYHVEPRSANKHIDFARDFGSAASLPGEVQDIVASNSLKCSKKDFDDLGPLLVTGFGGEDSERNGTIYIGCVQRYMDQQNHCLRDTCTTNAFVLAVFQCLNTWAGKGTNGSAVVDEIKRVQSAGSHECDEHEFRFIGYYFVNGWSQRSCLFSEIDARFRDYHGFMNVRYNTFGTSALAHGAFQFTLEQAFSFDIVRGNATNTASENKVFLSCDCDKPQYRVYFPTEGLLDIQEEMWPGSRSFKPDESMNDWYEDDAEDMLPNFMRGESALLDTLRYRVFVEYLSRLSDDDFKKALQTMQPESNNIPVQPPA